MPAWRISSAARTRRARGRGYANPGEQLLTTAQAAKLLGVSARTLARYAEQGDLSPTVILPSGHYRWAMSDVRRQLREMRQRPADGG